MKPSGETETQWPKLTLSGIGTSKRTTRAGNYRTARGLDNQTIARELVLTPKTVRNHVSNVLAKLNAGDRSQAIVIARRRGLGRKDERE